MMEPEISGEPIKQCEAVKAVNFIVRLGGVFSSPRKAFAEIGRAPRLTVPLIALFLASAFSGWYVGQKIDLDAATRMQLEKLVVQRRITQEQMEQQLAMSTVASSPVFLAIAGGISALAFCLAVAGYGRLFSMLGGAQNRYINLFEVSIYAMLAVSVVSTALLIIIMQIKGWGSINLADPGSIVASSLGAWIESVVGADALPGFIMRLAKAVDIFYAWTIALLSIGFSAVSKKLKTATAAIWLTGIYAIFSIISAAIGAAFGA